MSSGNKRLIMNTRERALSDDTNSMQAFIAKDRSQALKRLFNRPSTDRSRLVNPGLTPELNAVPAGALTGTVHDCYGGLMVRPDAGSYLLIDPGVAAFIAPPGVTLGADDSKYVVVDSIGLQTAGILTFTANASGSPRIDVVECQPVESVDLNVPRDILQTDGTVASVYVDKVASTKLNFRVRVGTPAAGFPAVDQDWMPLAVVVVQSGATSFAQADLYDVRPLVGDRSDIFATHKAMTSIGVPTTWDAGVSNCQILDRYIRTGAVDSSVREYRAYGHWVGEANGYRTGGVVRRNTPTAIADFGTTGDEAWLDVGATANQLTGANGFNGTTGALNAIMALFPMGLGRWVRYGQAAAPAGPFTGQTSYAGSRIPQGPNGILLVGQPGVISGSGECVVVGGFPAEFGAGTATQRVTGQIVGWAHQTAANIWVLHSTGRRHSLIQANALVDLATMNVSGEGTATAVLTGQIVGVANGTELLRGTTPLVLPANARTARCRMNISHGVSSTGGRVLVEGPARQYGMATDELAHGPGSVQAIESAITTNQFTSICDVDLRPKEHESSAAYVNSNVTAKITSFNTITTVTVRTLCIIGWED